MSSSSTSRKITLKSFYGEFFEVDEVVARESQTINVMIDDGVADKIPIPNVKGKTLAKIKIIEYCEKHVEAASANSDEEPAKKDLTSWDEDQFIKQLDLALLFDLIRSAHYLNIKNLMDLTYGTVADMMIGKTPEEIREKFHIKNDFTPEEEVQIKRENQWAFE